MSEMNSEELVDLTADIVSAFVSNNAVHSADLPDLIATVHSSLRGLMQPVVKVEEEEPLKPAVPIKKSVTDDYIISLEDGKKFKSLKRHLQTAYGMTPEQYRAKWNLPRDYPMVAPGYAARRSELARTMGLGRKSAAPSEPAANDSAPAPRKRAAARSTGTEPAVRQPPAEGEAPAKRRGRGKAA